MNFLIRGFLIGFSIAAPVGPIGVLCIRRTLVEGRLSGFMSGLGAATADAIYGSIAAFGLTFISNFLISEQIWLRIIGGIFLCFLGIRTFLARPAQSSSETKGHGLAGNFASTFFLTLTNPLTIISFAAIFAGLGLGSAGGDYTSAASLVCGVFAGSALWWSILSTGTGMFQKRFGSQGLRWINRVSGIIITGFGIFAICSLII